MSQTDPAPTEPRRGISLADPQEQYKQTMKAFEKWLEDVTPWLLEFGSWIFGGLIAFTLLIMAALITIGPIDSAIIVSTAAFAVALPLDVGGLFLLRLAQDMKHLGFEEELAQAFEEVGFSVGEYIPSPEGLEVRQKRRTGNILRTSFGMLLLTSLLSLTGVIAALWHIRWWVSVVFVAVVIIQVNIIVAVVLSQPRQSQEEKAQRRRYREEVTKQVREQYKKNKERV